METFHIALTAFFFAGTLANITVIVITYDERIHSFRNLSIGAINLICFYSIAAYALSTNNYALYWSAFIVNSAFGVYNTKRILNSAEFIEWTEDKGF